MGKTPRFARPYHVVEKHPHERGEDDRAGQAEVPNGGNTPTSVGKTDPLVLRVLERRKHPHERGEDGGEDISRRSLPETPPRAWGRHSSAVASLVKLRNTPTSVGKTPDFTGVDGGLVEIRFVALSVFQSQGACLKFQ